MQAKKAISFATKMIRGKYVMAGVPVIIKNKKNEILLGKRSKDVYYPLMWGLPGGMIEYRESIEKAVKREIKEELGINVRIIKHGKPCMHLPTKECPLQILDAPTYCKIQKGKPKAEDETTEVKWFKPKQIKKMKLAYNHKKMLKQERLI